MLTSKPSWFYLVDSVLWGGEGASDASGDELMG